MTYSPRTPTVYRRHIDMARHGLLYCVAIALLTLGTSACSHGDDHPTTALASIEPTESISATRALTSSDCQGQAATDELRNQWCGGGQHGHGICQSDGSCACEPMWCVDETTGQCTTPKSWGGNDLGFVCPAKLNTPALGVRVLYLGDGSSSHTGLIAHLESQGFVITDASNFYQWDGVTPSLADHDVVLYAALTNYDQFLSPTAESALIDWMLAGNTVVTTEWAAYGFHEYGNAAMAESDLATYMPVVYDDTDESYTSRSWTLRGPAHPYTHGVSTTFQSTQGGCSRVNARPGAQVLASATQCGPAMTTLDHGDHGGRVVHINDDMSSYQGASTTPELLTILANILRISAEGAVALPTPSEFDAWCGAGQHGHGTFQLDGSCACSEMWCVDANGQCLTAKKWDSNEVGYTCAAVPEPDVPMAVGACQEAGVTQQIKDAWCGSGANGHGTCLADSSCVCEPMWCHDCEGRCSVPRIWGGNDLGFICPASECDVSCNDAPWETETCDAADTVTISVGTRDPGTTLRVNNILAADGYSATFCPGNTVTFTSTYEGKTYEDVVDVFYDFEVSVQAHTVGGAGDVDTELDLIDDLNYTPYDIYIIHQDSGTGPSAKVIVTSANPPTDEAVRILGMHFDYPIAQVGQDVNLNLYSWESGDERYALGYPYHTGALVHIAEVVYGTLENTTGCLGVQTTGNRADTTQQSTPGDLESVINLVRAPCVTIQQADEQSGDIIIQEVHTPLLMHTDTKFSFWHLNVSKEFYGDCGAEESFNTDWPEQSALDDKMLWFKARNPAKWGLGPGMRVLDDGDTTPLVGLSDSSIAPGYLGSAWYSDDVVPGRYYNDDYNASDFNLFEVQLGDVWYSESCEDYHDYMFLVGPTFSVEAFLYWGWGTDTYFHTYHDSSDSNFHAVEFGAGQGDKMRLKPSGTPTNAQRPLGFDGDMGSAGSDFWIDYMVSTYGFNLTNDGDMFAPVFAMEVRDGRFHYVDSSPNDRITFRNADGQDVLILTNALALDFIGTDFDHSVGGHWIVQDDLLGYLRDTPFGSEMSMDSETVITSDADTHHIAITATNTIQNKGTAVESTMYIAYRKRSALGTNFTRVAMGYDSESAQWTGSVTLPACESLEDYLMVVAATDNDGNYGRCEVVALACDRVALGCADNARCVNTDGVPRCECPYGSSGDGSSCQVCPSGSYGTQDPQCVPCASEHYAMSEGMVACVACSRGCELEEGETTKCTSTTDRVCGTCPDVDGARCTFCPDGPCEEYACNDYFADLDGDPDNGCEGPSDTLLASATATPAMMIDPEWRYSRLGEEDLTAAGVRFSNNETWQISSISVHARVSDAVVLSVYAVDPGTNLPTGAALQQVPLTSTNGQFEFIEASVNLTLSPGTYAVLLSVEDGADSNSAIVKKHTSNGFTDFIYEYQNEWYQHGSYRFRFVIKGTTD